MSPLEDAQLELELMAADINPVEPREEVGETREEPPVLDDTLPGYTGQEDAADEVNFNPEKPEFNYKFL